MSTVKRIFRFLLLAILIMAITSLSQRTADLVGRAKKWQEEKKNLAQIEKENEELRAYLDYVESDSFLEKEARNSLGMSKEGEMMIVLPQKSAEETKIVSLPPSPVWRQWWELFFGRK